MRFVDTTTRLVETDPGLIEYHTRPVLMGSVLGPVCQHVAAAASQSGAWYGYLEPYPVATKTSSEHVDKDSVSSTPDHLQHDPGRWEKTLSPHDTKTGMIFFWCDRL